MFEGCSCCVLNLQQLVEAVFEAGHEGPVFGPELRTACEILDELNLGVQILDPIMTNGQFHINLRSSIQICC